MQRWIRILSMAALAATISVGTATAEDLLEDFLVLGQDPIDFLPGSEAASFGSLFFVGGSTRLTDPSGDAAIVGLDVRDGSEAWRAIEGAVDGNEEFTVVGVAAGRVCAAGRRLTSNTPGPPDTALLVACYRADRGERLWIRRIELGRPIAAEPLLHVSNRAVVVTLSRVITFGQSVITPLVLRFDARDGTGR